MNECPICYEDINYKTCIKLHCGHIFNKDCFVKFTINKCPLCRTPFDQKKILKIDSNKIICKNSNNHLYSPFVKNGECRFCFGRPIEFFLSKNQN